MTRAPDTTRTRPAETGPAACSTEAMSLYQADLDIFGALFWACDWDALAGHVVMPVTLEAPDATRHYDRPEDWVAAMREVRAAFTRLGATEYHRLCRYARFLPGTPRMIEGTHETFVMRGGSLLMTPFPSGMRLVLQDGGWRACWVRTEIRNRDLPTVFDDNAGRG